MDNDEIRMEEYNEALQRLTEELTEAIGKSLETGETVDVMIDGSLVSTNDALTIIGNLADDYDCALASTTSYNVCGTFESDTFNVCIYTA